MSRLAPVLETIFSITVSYHILVASSTLMALFQNRAIRVQLATSIWYDTLMKNRKVTNSIRAISLCLSVRCGGDTVSCTRLVLQKPQKKASYNREGKDIIWAWRKKTCLWCLRKTKAQTSLRKGAGWSAAFLSAFWISKLATSEISIF